MDSNLNLNSNSFVLFELVCFSKKEKKGKSEKKKETQPTQNPNLAQPKPPWKTQPKSRKPAHFSHSSPLVGPPSVSLLFSLPGPAHASARPSARPSSSPFRRPASATRASPFPLALTKLARASMSPRACPRYALRRFLRLTRRSHSSAASSTRTPVPRFARYLPPLSRVTRTLRPRPTGPTCRRRSFRRPRPLLSRCPAWPTCRLCCNTLI